jgi:hypothetical protein
LWCEMGERVLEKGVVRMLRGVRGSLLGLEK